MCVFELTWRALNTSTNEMVVGVSSKNHVHVGLVTGGDLAVRNLCYTTSLFRMFL